MTTAAETSTQVARDTGMRVLRRAGMFAVACGLLVVLVARITAGGDAVRGALVGSVLAVGVFAFGSVTVETIARIMPSAALMVALMTYTLQVVLMALAFVALDGSGALDDGLDPTWLGVSVIVATAVWLVAQVVLTTRRRIPVYDLPEHGSDGPSTGSAR